MTGIEKLHISPTEDTPEVVFDPGAGTVSMVGRSLPENAFNFFKPVIDLAKQYVNILPAKDTTLVFDLDYFNSSSGRFIFELLNIFEENKSYKTKVTVKWRTEKDDELMIEKGEELKSLLAIPFTIELKD